MLNVTNFKKSTYFFSFVWLILSLFVLASTLSNKTKDEDKKLFSDQATHVMAAMSVWHDFDLRYTERDLKRFKELFPGEVGPRGLYLKKDDSGKYYYAKPFLYATFSAPFYGMLGTSGFIIFNFILLVSIAFLIYRASCVSYGEKLSSMLACAFVFLSPFVAWVSVPHPDLLIAFLLFAGGYIILKTQKLGVLFFVGVILGLSVFEKFPFFILIPFFLLAADHLSWKCRLYLLFFILLGWTAPTALMFLQDGNVLAYQGLRFGISRPPFPFEQGWIPPSGGATDHIFDIKALVFSVINNISLLPDKLHDFLLGRQTSILLYFPVALFFIITTICFLNKRSAILLAGMFSFLAMNWLAFPSNGFGGGGSYGSRYLMQVLPLSALSLALINFNAEHCSKALGKFIAISGVFFLCLSVFFQYKVIPPSEELVKNPAEYLTSYPAKVFPLEEALLPSIPIYSKGFADKSNNHATTLYRINGVDDDGVITINGTQKSAEFVIYQISDDAPVPSIDVYVTSPTIMRAELGDSTSERIVVPGESTQVKLGDSVFKKRGFDLSLKSVIRWGSIQVSLTPITDRVNNAPYYADIWLSALDAEHLVPLSEKIGVQDFQELGIIKHFYWSHNEEWGVWTNGPHSTLEIPIPPEIDSDLELTFWVHAYVPSEHPLQSIEACLNGKVCDKWMFTQENNHQVQTIKIDKDLVGNESVFVDFYMNNPISPASLGHGSDPRLLGIGLESLKVSKTD